MDDLIYLDNGATSFPKPESVYRFMDDFYRKGGVNPGRSGYDCSIETGNLVQDTRKMLTRYLKGTDPNRLIFSMNSTDALNLAIFGLLKPGDHVISTCLEHNAVLRPLHHMSLYNGVDVDYVSFDKNGFVSPEDFIPLFRPETRLVVVNHGSNVIGTVQPVGQIGKICRERGVTFLVDASQTAGKLPIDMRELNIDVIAFTGHKSLLGPTGTGGLYVGEDVVIRHTRAGGTGVKSAQRHHLEEYPYRLEYGTPNVLGIAGLHAGIKWLYEQGMEKIHAHELELTRLLVDGLNRIDRVETYCAEGANDHIGVVSFNIRGLDPENTGTLLDGEYNIAVRTGLQCAPLVHEGLGTDKLRGTVRISFGPFNNTTHVEMVLDAVQEIAAHYASSGEKNARSRKVGAGN